jgi:hypothetical protein
MAVSDPVPATATDSEQQQTDYPSVGPDRPEHEPRGYPRGAAFSWYTYRVVRRGHGDGRGGARAHDQAGLARGSAADGTPATAARQRWTASQLIRRG